MVEILGGSIGVMAGGFVGTVVVVATVDGNAGAGLEPVEGDAVGLSGSTDVSGIGWEACDVACDGSWAAGCSGTSAACDEACDGTCGVTCGVGCGVT